MNTVKIVQDYKARWHIENHKGDVMFGPITISNPVEAEKYLINYMSSYFPWVSWTYTVVPLKKGAKHV